MKLIIIRHAKALDRSIAKTRKIKDADRYLLPSGEKEFSALIREIKAKLGGVDILLTSPYLRTTQTAEIVCQHIRVRKCIVDAIFAPGNDVKKMAKKIFAIKRSKVVVIVGHEPELGQLAGFLITGRPDGILKFKKGSVVALQSWRRGFVLSGFWRPK